MERYVFQVNGLEIGAQFRRRDRETVFLPLLQRLTELQEQKGRRICVFLAAPPAAGKSTFCLYLEKLSREEEGLTPVQSVGIDGFHYTNEYLQSHFIERNGERLPLSRVKGGPESYDVAKLSSLLERLQEEVSFPVYDRRLHEPVDNAILLREKIIILEGNWLLLDEAPWNQLKCDYSIFWPSDKPEQLERVVQRKIMGGFEEAAARKFVMENDLVNIQRCMANSRRGDFQIILED